MLHEHSGDADQNANDSCDDEAVPVVSSRLSPNPLLVDVAVAGEVVENFVLQQVFLAAVFVVLSGVHRLRFFVLQSSIARGGSRNFETGVRIADCGLRIAECNVSVPSSFISNAQWNLLCCATV